MQRRAGSHGIDQLTCHPSPELAVHITRSQHLKRFASDSPFCPLLVYDRCLDVNLQLLLAHKVTACRETQPEAVWLRISALCFSTSERPRPWLMQYGDVPGHLPINKFFTGKCSCLSLECSGMPPEDQGSLADRRDSHVPFCQTHPEWQRRNSGRPASRKDLLKLNAPNLSSA